MGVFSFFFLNSGPYLTLQTSFGLAASRITRIFSYLGFRDLLAACQDYSDFSYLGFRFGLEVTKHFLKGFPSHMLVPHKGEGRYFGGFFGICVGLTDFFGICVGLTDFFGICIGLTDFSGICIGLTDFSGFLGKMAWAVRTGPPALC